MLQSTISFIINILIIQYICNNYSQKWAWAWLCCVPILLFIVILIFLSGVFYQKEISKKNN